MGDLNTCPYCGIIFISNFGHNCDGEKIDPNKRLNLHRDHIASCLCCANLSVYDGYPGYSEYTPGEPPHTYCDRRHFDSSNDGWETMISMFHDTGRICLDFEAKD